MNRRIPIALLLVLAAPLAAAGLPPGYWPVELSQPLLDASLVITLDPETGHLTNAETQALQPLIAAGSIVQALYEQQLHAGAADARRALDELHAAAVDPPATSNLLQLYYLFQGPIATTLDNQRVPFLPVAPPDPGKNVYPAGLTRAEIDAYLATHPRQSATILGARTLVRRASEENIAADLQRLDAYPAIDQLRVGLRRYLEALHPDAGAFYAVPYALAYAPQLIAARQYLEQAADLLADESPDFAAYLRNRGRDLLTGDYESGDASWVSAEFENLNLQFGSYETYDDALLGTKAFYSASVLVRDAQKSRALAAAMTELQSMEDSLPFEHHKRVRAQIPVGVYNVVADFGQARGANTATILPNDADHARKYGRIVLIRNNILTNPELFAIRKQRFDAVVNPRFRAHLTMDGGFNRTLWHEIGHYLGVSATADERSLAEALAEFADLLEEMKSDLVSLHVAPTLREIGYYDDAGLRAHYADGIRRTLQVVRPRADQPYQNMQLMQFNFFMEYGLIEPGPDSALLTISYDRYHEAVDELLSQVLQLQYTGDYDMAKAFVRRWNYWDERVHGKLAERMQESSGYRYTMVRYAKLED